MPASSGNPMQGDVCICYDGTYGHSSLAERQSMMHDDRIAEVRHLYHHIHRDAPPPQNKREHQAAFVLIRMRQMVLDLLMQGVTPTTLALTLFYHWLPLAGPPVRHQHHAFRNWSATGIPW